MLHPWGLLPVVALFLSGCAGAGGSQREGPGSGSETGGLEGSVLSEELVPLTSGVINATLVGGGEPTHEQNISADGGFAFDALTPGRYIVAANVSGFYPREAQVQVEAGSTASLHLILAPRPAREPHVLVASWEGFNTCGVALIVTPANMCGTSGEKAVDEVVENVTRTVMGGVSRTGRNYTIPDGFAAVVGETTWRGGDEASAYYYNRSQERKNDNESSTIFSSVLDVAQGKHPLRVFMIPGGQKENATQGVFAAYYGKVSDRAAFELRYAVWWNGYFGENFGAANAVCNQFAVPRCTGVGATINFRFTHWMSVFMYDRPEDLKAYTVIPDA